MSEQRAAYTTAAAIGQAAISATAVIASPDTVTLVTSRRWAWVLAQLQERLNDCDEVAVRRSPVTGRLQVGAIIAFEDKPE